MTIFLRALWGPFGREETRGCSQVDWHFFGIREDNTMGRWILRYEVATRKFKTFAQPMPTKPACDCNIDAFVPHRPMLHGRTFLDILLPRLSKEDLAAAVALSIRKGQ